MHPGLDRDYRHLLSRLIPKEYLTPQRQAEIESALVLGDRIGMVREAYLAMEELVRGGVFRNVGTRSANGTVSVSYRSSREALGITLTMTSAEWNVVTGRMRRGEGILPSVFAGIISSLALNDSPKTIVGRIDEMLSLAEHISKGARAKLLFLNAVPSVRDWSRETVSFLPMGEALKRHFYHSCLTSGMPHTFLRLSSVHTGEGAFAFESGTRAVIMIPLLARDVRWAILEVHLAVDTPPDPGTLSNFHILGQGIVRLIENNKHLEKMVSTDRLTQVHNRNSYELQIPLEIERANRNKLSFGFLIIDIDDFKQINDSFGHDVGDQVLRLVAQTVRKSLRKIDLLFRYGGEEFVVLLPGAGADSARRTAERIRGIVARSEHAIGDGRKAKVTISIGGCIYPEHAQNESQLFRMADTALYAAKEEGKNRVVFSGD
jgi:diguanylate cyclase (GGDEF)-like protein